MIIRVVTVLCLTVAWPGSASTADDKAFWHAIAKSDYAVPAGSSALELSRSLNAMLGSADPELRDEIAYTTFVQWIYQKRILTGDDLRPLIADWLSNLSTDIGGVGSDAVLRRSFSALVLSVAVARDNAAPFLDEKQFRTILDGALAYLQAEKDVRGYDPDKGWMHSTAHTADLLKFLGRSRYVTAADQASILNAVTGKLRSVQAVFVYGEDERLARAVLSIVARHDFDGRNFRDWLTASKPVFPPGPHPQVEALQRYQNLKNMLAKLEVLLISEAPRAPNAQAASAAVQEILKGAF
jgi:Protein of unknown function (DUF2785)